MSMPHTVGTRPEADSPRIALVGSAPRVVRDAPRLDGVGPTDGPGTRPAWSIATGAWLLALIRIRDAVAGLPRLPSGVWLGGLALVLAIQLARLWRFRRAVRAARPAPRSVQRVVAAAAEQIGLKAAPQVRMVEGGVGPLVTCGRHVRLLVPAGLWAQLDSVGRRAILCHELAHLRRGDHWICRGELIVAALFWWNPLVWWVRRRLHEEAEVCCDAWVTWLMPGHRRAYAQALLQTRQFLSNTQEAEPVAGIGITTGRAARLARRIKMVMTGTVRPRLSLPGVALAASLALTGWLAGPARSCPTDEKCKISATVAAKCAGLCAKCGVKCEVLDAFKCCVKCAAPAEAAEGSSTFELYLADRARASNSAAAASGQGYAVDRARAEYTAAASARGLATDRALAAAELAAAARSKNFAPEAYVEPRPPAAGVYVVHPGAAPDDHDAELHERMARLERMVEELARKLDREPPQSRGADGLRGRRLAPTSPLPQPGPTPPMPPMPETAPAPMVAPELRIVPGGETVAIRYELPPGRLEALTKLMSRSDIPILIRPGEGYIEVMATKPQHAAFKAFVDLLTGSKETVQRPYRLPRGKLKDLTELMVRDDVPILVSPTDDEIVVHGTGVEHAVFRAFVDLIHPTEPRGVFDVPAAPRATEAAREHRQQQRQVQREVQRIEREAQRRQREIQRREKADQTRELRERRRSVIQGADLQTLLERAKEALGERDIEVLRERIESLQDRAAFEAALEQAASRAAELEMTKVWLDTQAQILEANGEAMNEQAAAIESQAEIVRSQAETIDLRSEQLNELAEMLEHQAEQLEERSTDGDAPAGGSVEAALEQANALAADADRLIHEADQLAEQADGLVEEALAIEDEAAEKEGLSEALQALAEVLHDVMHDLDEQFAAGNDAEAR